MRRRYIHAWLAAIAAVVVLALAPRESRACSCRQPSPPQTALEEADAVFEARAFIMSNDGQRAHYGFEVDRVWKGDVALRVEISTALHSATCGRNYEIGTQYIVYAHRLPNGELSDNLCSRTRPARTAGEDLAVLGAGHDPRSPEQAPLIAPGSSPGTTEPPRIEPAPVEPPPTAPSRRGCAVEKPHTSGGLLALALLGLAVAIGRRRAVRSPTRSRRPPSRPSPR